MKHIISARIPHGFRFLAPILLGAALLGIVISTVWFGGKRESLAAYAESNLLRFALKSSPWFVNDPKAVIISVKDTDLMSLERAPMVQLRDAHIREYASIVERVAQHNPKMIVVSWLGNAQPLTAEYLKPLTDTIDRLGLAERTILAIHFFAAGSIPDEISRKYQVAEARDCYYDVNTFCTYNPSWTWMPQKLANAFWAHKEPWTISTNLPHTLPNFVLNLPDPSSIPTFSFLDFRPPVTAEISEGSVIFIGNDATQDLQFRNNKDLLQRTFVASSPQARSLLTDGIPFHVFWAGMTQMFIESRTIAVVPDWLCSVALVFMCLSIMFAIRYLRGLALGPFLLCALSLPFLNVLGVRFSAVYMPIVPIIAAGFALFIAATFLSISAYSYRRWRLLAVKGAAERTADIKENFISLISHNLNTPIAQLRGLLDVLLQRQKDLTPDLMKALLYLESMRITVRAVLNTSWISENPPTITTSTVRQFWDSFLASDESVLGRLGISLDVLPKQDDEDNGEIWFYRYSVESNTYSSTLLYALVLAHIRFNATHIHLKLSPRNPEPADPKGLVIRLEWSPSRELKRGFSVDFMGHALSRYLDAATQFRNIAIQFETNALVLTLPDGQL